MNKIRNHSKELILLTILLAVAVSVVNAAVFVYYPMTINAVWQTPPVVFYEGSNAGQNDLGTGNQIDVDVDYEGSSVTITVHPCKWQTTYYHDILQIVNNDDNAYNVWLTVSTQTYISGVARADLIVDDGSTTYTLDLTDPGDQIGPISLSASGSLIVSLVFEASGNTDTSTAVISLAYSTSGTLMSPP